MHCNVMRSVTAGSCSLALRCAHASAPALAADPVPNKGDTAWMLISTALVLLMTIPGLALFYGGLVRSKNMLSVLMQVFAIVCLVSIIWVLYGYSLAFTSGGSLNAYIGGFSKAFLQGRRRQLDRRDVLQRRRHPRVRLHRLPDDVRLHHAGADRRRLRRAHEVLRAAAVRRAVGDGRLLPDRAHGLVLGRPRCASPMPPRRSPPPPATPRRRPRPHSKRCRPTPA